MSIQTIRVVLVGTFPSLSGGGSFLSANIARVDLSGDDSSGTVGDQTKPFETVQAAITALETQGGFSLNSPAVISLPLVDSAINVTTSLRFLVLSGQSNTNNGSNPAIGSLTLTSDGLPSGIYFGAINVWLNGILAPNIDPSSSLSVFLNSAIISGDITSEGNLTVSAPYNSGSVNGAMSCGSGTSLLIRGLIGSYADTNFPVINAVNSPVTVYYSLIDTITAASSIDLYDSRVRENDSGVTPVYHDILLNPALMDFSTLPTSLPSTVGAAWIDTTGGNNIVKVKL